VNMKRFLIVLGVILTLAGVAAMGQHVESGDRGYLVKVGDKAPDVTRNVVIDKTGTIVYLTRLYDNKEFAGMVKKIEELLK